MYPGDQPPDHEDYVNHLNVNLSQSGRFRAFRSLAFNSHDESGSKLELVDCRTLIIMGTADPDFPDPSAEANGLADAMNAELLLIDGAGHYPQAQAPATVAIAIEEFAHQLD